MNQSELIAKTAAISGAPQKTVKAVLEAASAVAASTLTEGEEVTLPMLGKLVVKTRAARTGRNPKTGEAITIPAKRVPDFVASKQLKDTVGGAQ